MDDRLWQYFSDYVNIPVSERKKIHEQFPNAKERKQALIPHLISTHPSLSWGLVAYTLYQMGTLSLYNVASCLRALDHLQQTFPTGNTYCNPYNTSLGDFPPHGCGCKCVPIPPWEIFPVTLTRVAWAHATLHIHVHVQAAVLASIQYLVVLVTSTMLSILGIVLSVCKTQSTWVWHIVRSYSCSAKRRYQLGGKHASRSRVWSVVVS